VSGERREATGTAGLLWESAHRLAAARQRADRRLMRMRMRSALNQQVVLLREGIGEA